MIELRLLFGLVPSCYWRCIVDVVFVTHGRTKKGAGEKNPESTECEPGFNYGAERFLDFFS